MRNETPTAIIALRRTTVPDPLAIDYPRQTRPAWMLDVDGRYMGTYHSRAAALVDGARVVDLARTYAGYAVHEYDTETPITVNRRVRYLRHAEAGTTLYTGTVVHLERTPSGKYVLARILDDDGSLCEAVMVHPDVCYPIDWRTNDART